MSNKKHEVEDLQSVKLKEKTGNIIWNYLL